MESNNLCQVCGRLRYPTPCRSCHREACASCVENGLHICAKTVPCQVCGTSNAEAALACRTCRAILVQKDEDYHQAFHPFESFMRCGYCGASSGPGARSCPRCGSDPAPGPPPSLLKLDADHDSGSEGVLVDDIEDVEESAPRPSEQSRCQVNTFRTPACPALGVATWNVQRVGAQARGRGATAKPVPGEAEPTADDDAAMQIDALYKLLHRYFDRAANYYKIATQRTRPGKENRAEQLLPIMSVLRRLSEVKSLPDFKRLHQDHGPDRVTLFRLLTTYFRPFPAERSAYHKILLIEHVVEMFALNPWLDALVLQEVNMGVQLLADGIKEYGLRRELALALYSGPLTSSRTEDKKGYQEYYPIVVRKGVTVEVCGFANSIEVKYWPIEKGCQETCHWNSAENTYRPVIFYRLKKDDGTVACLGVVHTTPGGAEFNRVFDYNQIKPAMDRLRETVGARLIIGGDYYLTAEAVVQAYDRGLDRQKQLAREEWSEGLPRAEEHLQLLERLPHDNQLAAQLDGYTSTLRTLFVGKMALLNTPSVTEALDALKEYQRAAYRDLKSEVPVLFDGHITKPDAAYLAIVKREREIEDRHIAELRKLVEKLAPSKSDDGAAQDEAHPLVVAAIVNLRARIRRWVIALRDLGQTLESHGEYQLIRNTAKLTFASQLLQAKWLLAQPVFATNWHDPPKSPADWDKGTIADFFVGTSDWIAPPVGMMIPMTAGIALADTMDLVITKYWRAISDHCPIGAYFSTGKDERRRAVIARVTREKFQESMRFLRRHSAFLPQLSASLQPDDFERHFTFHIDVSPFAEAEPVLSEIESEYSAIDFQSWDVEQLLRQFD